MASPVLDLERVIETLTPAEVVGRDRVPIRDLAYVAREARAGSLFFCVPGARADGHDFAGEAVANGAVALVVERRLAVPVPQLVVGDARRAMALVADEFFGQPTRKLEVAGVTGTNGKTTTAFLLHSMLVAVDEPRNAIWGGVVAAPAFRDIARFCLQYLEIPPDAPLISASARH